MCVALVALLGRLGSIKVGRSVTESFARKIFTVQNSDSSVQNSDSSCSLMTDQRDFLGPYSTTSRLVWRRAPR